MLKINKLTFKYPNGYTAVENLSLHVEPGDLYAFIGHNGAGKTTTIKSVVGILKFDEGEILIDGKNIKEIDAFAYRKHLGVVLQETFLFGGSIYDNIRYGNENATYENVIDAAKKANIHEFIMSLENGYDTYVGERGVKLSGGQKQRISIARAFLKNPPILILDEATSALDNITEMQIQAALESLSVGRTTIVVAHRLSTVKNADEIMVISGDGIIEKGNHEELIALDGVYANLYQYQFKE